MSSAHSGNRNAKITKSYLTDQTYLITPTMDLSGLSAATLTFWMVNESWDGDINALRVYYRVNEEDWNELRTITDEHSDWKEMTIALTGLAANYQIGFLMTDNYGYAVGLDHIAIAGFQSVTATENPYTLTGLAAETDYEVKVRSVLGDDASLWSPVITFTTMPLPVVMLADGGTDNAEAIETNNGEHANVTLGGRTLYKDGAWNTLCLPFSLTLAGSPLAGAEARTLESATLTDGTLDLQFGDAVTELVAGTPYIIKWEKLVIRSADDWNSFASDVAAGNSYAGKVVQLGSDIEGVTQMVGTADYPFNGTFDGAGYKLDIDISNDSDQGTAPFRYISNATITNCYRRTAGGEQGDDASNMSAAVLANALNNGGADWQVDDDDVYVVPVFGKYESSSITDPTFKDVTIDKTMNDKDVAGVVTFKGNYDFRSFAAEDRSILLMGAENTLYWPQSGATIGACRAYFQLADGITAGDVSNARLFFGTTDTQGIVDVETDASRLTPHTSPTEIYSLDGKKLNHQPTRKGIYIQNGRKVVVK